MRKESWYSTFRVTARCPYYILLHVPWRVTIFIGWHLGKININSRLNDNQFDLINVNSEGR